MTFKVKSFFLVYLFLFEKVIHCAYLKKDKKVFPANSEITRHISIVLPQDATVYFNCTGLYLLAKKSYNNLWKRFT